MEENFKILRVFDDVDGQKDFKVYSLLRLNCVQSKIPGVFLLASEVWAPLATPAEKYYTSDDAVVMFALLIFPNLFKIPLPGEKAIDIELLVKWLVRDAS